MCKKAIVTLFCFFVIGTLSAQQKKTGKLFTEALDADSCKFDTKGRNKYFILEPGYQMILEGKEDNKPVKLVITVLNETKKIGNTETRIVEENESVNGVTVEISRNYFAYCKNNGSIYYFGEEVDMYKDGKIINHEGSWIAEGNNKPGLAMPALPLLGSRFYQEIAPGVAMDRAEIVSNSESMTTQAGHFANCLKIEETNALKPMEKEYKYYAPGIGLIKDDQLTLVKAGFVR